MTKWPNLNASLSTPYIDLDCYKVFRLWRPKQRSNKQWQLLSTKCHCHTLSLSSLPRVPPSAETCPRPTPWFAWPMMMTTRILNPAKSPRSRLSSAGVWRTSWRAPAPSASPQQTTPAPCPGINPVLLSPAPAPTTTTAPCTELVAAFLLSASIVQYAYRAQYGSTQYCAVPILYLRWCSVSALWCFHWNTEQ